jgi:hypothetical protein
MVIFEIEYFWKFDVIFERYLKIGGVKNEEMFLYYIKMAGHCFLCNSKLFVQYLNILLGYEICLSLNPSFPRWESFLQALKFESKSVKSLKPSVVKVTVKSANLLKFRYLESFVKDIIANVTPRQWIHRGIPGDEYTKETRLPSFHGETKLPGSDCVHQGAETHR